MGTEKEMTKNECHRTHHISLKKERSSKRKPLTQSLLRKKSKYRNHTVKNEEVKISVRQDKRNYINMYTEEDEKTAQRKR